jgi:hypothetical protein
VLPPTGRSCEDPWVAAASLIAVTERMKFMVAIRPGLTSVGVAARMAATFDRLSNGRLLLNVVTGADPVELAGDGLPDTGRKCFPDRNEWTCWGHYCQSLFAAIATVGVSVILPILIHCCRYSSRRSL